MYELRTRTNPLIRLVERSRALQSTDAVVNAVVGDVRYPMQRYFCIFAEYGPCQRGDRAIRRPQILAH